MFKLCFIAAVLIACIQVNNGQQDATEAEWEKFQVHFPIKHKNAAETAKRKANFAKVHAEIKKHNKKNSTFELEHNKFSAMDDEEKKKYIRRRPPRDARYISGDELSTRLIATSVDYRTNTCMQPVKDQGDCGSCWAHSAIAVVDFGKCIKTGTKVALSEQQLVDCSTDNSGCDGGSEDVAWTYLASAGGVDTSASYPYTAVQGTCKAGTAVKGATISATSPVTYINAYDTNTMKTLLSNKRLVSVGIAVVNSFFNYKSGVYNPTDCTTNILGYHAITVVGYGTLSGVDYWVIRNSWGSGWGSSGYVLFRRGINLCEVEQYAMTTTVAS